ncbi:hypothetical protein BgAZ_201010 [Babesia gibsoni]|uniref:Uncharacterized protein n=1 Tax=Babesia gibsoni TaxID=33632 RepID=A0AAD8LI99_BABGI|nr:hypothetical protein BgAZ_201010 [Babesia gibsoni]
MLLGSTSRNVSYIGRFFSIRSCRSRSSLSGAEGSRLYRIATASSPSALCQLAQDIETGDFVTRNGLLNHHVGHSTALHSSVESRATASLIPPSEAISPYTVEHDGYISVSESDSTFVTAILNVLSKRCTDISVWSVLLDHISCQPNPAATLDATAINAVLHKIASFRSRNPLVVSKLKSIVSILLERVNHLVESELNCGVVDTKLRKQLYHKRGKPWATEYEQTEEPSREHVATYDRKDKPLSLDDVLKLWQLINTNEQLKNNKTEQLLSTWLLSNQHEIDRFDLGRTLRSITILLKRANSLSVAEEKWICNLFRRLCINLLKQSHVGFSSGRSSDACVTTECDGRKQGSYTQAERKESCNRAGDFEGRSIANETSGESNISQHHISIKHGNTYLTVGHIQDVFDVLASLFKKLSKVSLASVLTSSICNEGINALIVAADQVLMHSLDLEARCRLSEVAMYKSEGMETGICDSLAYQGVKNKHLKVFNSMMEVMMHLDREHLQSDQHCPNLTSIRNSISALLFKSIGFYKPFDARSNSFKVKFSHYSLLYSIVQGECCIKQIEGAISLVMCILEHVRDELSNRVNHSTLGLLAWVEKIVTLINDLAVTHPMAQELTASYKGTLEVLREAFNENMFCKTGNPKIYLLFLRLMQNQSMLMEGTLVEYVQLLHDRSVVWDEWEGRDVAMLSDILVRSKVESSKKCGSSKLEQCAEILLSHMFNSYQETHLCHLNRLNNEQMISLTACAFKYNNIICKVLESELLVRINSMNFWQCLQCLSMASREMGDTLKTRIKHLLSKPGTVIDISPALSLLCGDVNAIASFSSEDDGRHSYLNLFDLYLPCGHDARCNKAPHLSSDLTNWLLSVMLGLDRDIIILNDVEYLKRKLERKLHRAIGVTPISTSVANKDQNKAPLIALEALCVKFTDLYKHLDGVEQSILYKNLNLDII